MVKYSEDIVKYIFCRFLLVSYINGEEENSSFIKHTFCWVLVCTILDCSIFPWKLPIEILLLNFCPKSFSLLLPTTVEFFQFEFYFYHYF